MIEKNDITIEELIEKQNNNYNGNANIDLIMKAYKLAEGKHKNQCRMSGEPYIVHPINVANILADLNMDDETICAALMHDLVEDTDITISDIEKMFGKSIADMVSGVTKLGTLRYTSAEERQVENYRKMFFAMGKDIRIILIKLADRLHNMRTLKYLKEERRIANSRETMDLYAPLANRLGIYSLKWELEDLSFKYLWPDEYHEIVNDLNKKRAERLSFIDGMKEELQNKLIERNIDAEVTGRAKHLYSIYRKMQRTNKTLDQIYDLFALRILVNDVRECYEVLGIVHEMYTPMPGRFKDYIAVPKANMYQSIHTTLLGPKGTPFEVQIRTWDMHSTAEFGIAAHWAYKEASNNGKKENISVKSDKLSWLREAIEWQKDTANPDEFLKSLKTELFEDEVYIFTPKGAIKVLPLGATPIDFAYSIHEEIGHKMVGCKINGKMMPIITELSTGDIVEILTSDTSKGPSRDWLKFVKSNSAKNRINQWFKRVQREDNIEKGKDLIEKEIKKLGMMSKTLMKPEWIDIILNKYKYNTIEDMYSSVGFGTVSEKKIVARLLNEYNKEHDEENFEEKIEELSKAKPDVHKNSKNGVIVKGIDNCLIKLSKCCNPLPGDEIIGYITKGRGVSIHRKDCSNLHELIGQEERIIDVEWIKDSYNSYNVEIEIYALDRVGLLRDIIKNIENEKVKLNGVNTKMNKDSTLNVSIKVETEDIDKLSKLIRKIEHIESVISVFRKRS